MKTTQLKNLLALDFLSTTLWGCVVPLETTSTNRSTTHIQYINPSWAPAHHPGVRYYYLPDIEVYYDLSDQSFVYLHNGQWIFTRRLPSMYADFDLNKGYVISLNINIYQPWRHHHYYISHYPRYYYKSYYPKEYHKFRGFNENNRKAFYHREYENNIHDKNFYRYNEKHKSKKEANEDRRDFRNHQYDKSSRSQELNTPQNSDRPENKQPRTSRYENSNITSPPSIERKETTTPSPNSNDGYNREPQNPNYYGRNIGKPVKVESQMKEQKQKESKEKTNEGRSPSRR